MVHPRCARGLVALAELAAPAASLCARRQLTHLYEVVDSAKRPDDVHAVQALVHVHKHSACRVACPALEHRCCRQVQVLHHEEAGKQGGGHDGVQVDRSCDDGETGQQDHKVDGRHVQRVRQRLVERVLSWRMAQQRALATMQCTEASF